MSEPILFSQDPVRAALLYLLRYLREHETARHLCGFRFGAFSSNLKMLSPGSLICDSGNIVLT